MATIIKAGGDVSAAGRGEPVPLNLDDMAQQARQCLDQAREETEQILARARERAEEVEREAEQAGYEAGLQRADEILEARLRERLGTAIPALEEAAAHIKTARQEWIAHWREHSLRVALAMAACIVRREVRHAPEITLDLVSEALRLAAGNERIVLHLHPEDLATLAPRIDALLESLQGAATAKVMADAGIERGGCRLETQFGEIDQQFTAQLQRIAQELQ